MSRFPLTARHCQRGFALVLVLWVLSLLTIMAGSFALSMRREATLVAGIKNTAKATALAESGIAIAETMLLLPEQGKRWLTDGSIYQINTEDAFTGMGGTGGQIRIKMLAETGKIDINKAEQKLLESLFLQSPLADDEKQRGRLVAAILDWRDKDDLVHIDGAESKEYQDANLSYQPSNKPFQAIEELRLVLGMDEATYQWLLPLITVYSGQAQVNAQLATKEVLSVLPDADLAMVEDYIRNRRDSILNGLPIPASPVADAKNAPMADSEVLTILCEARMDDDAKAVISAVIKAGGEQDKPFQVLKWQNLMATNESLFADAASELVIREYAESEFNH
ncbi:MAG: general secretion pathway protein GspK [Methylobacter sp.]|nr:MAG: general secretion pathway protein GspK [Methylobacter sp.]